MKKRFEYIADSFIDYKGIEHKFIMCACSFMLPEDTIEVQEYDGDGYNYQDTLTKALSLGVAICSPVDTFNQEIGYNIASSRAEKNNPVLYVTESGIINTTMVQALLKQEAEYLKNNPENYIKGYGQAKQDYKDSIKMADLRKEFTLEDETVYAMMKSNPERIKEISEYFEFCKKHNCL